MGGTANQIQVSRCQKKEFLVSQFMKFTVTDNKSVFDQFLELEYIAGQLEKEWSKIDESILVGSIIDKLSQSWWDHKKSLKHKKNEMCLEELAQDLQIEEQLRLCETKEDQPKFLPRVNVLEERPQQSAFKNRVHNKPEFKMNKRACFYCNKVGHFKKNCRLYMKEKWKQQGKGFLDYKKCTSQVHVTEEILVAVILEVNMVGHGSEWWLDSRATRYVTFDKNMLKSFQGDSDENILYIENSSTARC